MIYPTTQTRVNDEALTNAYGQLPGELRNAHKFYLYHRLHMQNVKNQHGLKETNRNPTEWEKANQILTNLQLTA